MNLSQNQTIGIIGGGFGGLALGIRMQNMGYDVTILEKNPDVGGHASQIKDRGYTFDMGPSLITAKNLIDDLFGLAGKKVEDYLEFHLLDPFYRIYFHDQSHIDYCDDVEKMKAQMAVYNKDDAANYDRFMEYSKKLYEAVIEDGLGKKPFTYNELVGFLPEALKLDAFFPVHHKVGRYFKDFRHKFLFSFHPLFIGGNPFTAPSVYLMIPYL
jgi:phytoene desaturase